MYTAIVQFLPGPFKYSHKNFEIFTSVATIFVISEFVFFSAPFNGQFVVFKWLHTHTNTHTINKHNVMNYQRPNQ